MPYIPKEQRQRIRSGDTPKNAGELNFAVTDVCLRYLDALRRPARYQDFNDVLGALEGAKLELYRRLVAPYEDTKIASEGDVYQNTMEKI